MVACTCCGCYAFQVGVLRYGGSPAWIHKIPPADQSEWPASAAGSVELCVGRVMQPGIASSSNSHLCRKTVLYKQSHRERAYSISADATMLRWVRNTM
jgi:hypothetical protein